MLVWSAVSPDLNERSFCSFFALSARPGRGFVSGCDSHLTLYIFTGFYLAGLIWMCISNDGTAGENGPFCAGGSRKCVCVSVCRTLLRAGTVTHSEGNNRPDSGTAEQLMPRLHQCLEGKHISTDTRQHVFCLYPSAGETPARISV